MKKLILVLTILLFVTAFLCADVYIKTKTHTDAVEMAGHKQPAKDDFSEQWIGKNKLAMLMKQMSTVIDLDANKIFIIMHASKNYIESTLPLDMSKLMPAQMAQMMSMMKMKVSVNPNGQTKKIQNWNCEGYDLIMELTGMMPMNMNFKVWATTDVPFDWKTFQEKMYPTIMKQAMRMPFGEEAIKEFQKIKGYQVATEMSMSVMGQNIKVTTAVQEITEKAAPAGIYAPPAGYTKTDKLSMQSMNTR